MSEADARLRAAFAVRTPEPAGPFANAATFGWRTLLKIKHMPEQLFDIVVTPVMFTVIFTYLFGGALAGSTDAYLQFLLPGILVQTVMFTSIYTGFTLNGDIAKGVFDRFRAMPVWRPAPLAGAMLGDALRYTASSVLVIAVGLLMGYRPEAGWPSLLWALLLLDLFALGFGWIFTVLALLVRTPSTVMTLGWLLLMPLTFVSNVFVAPDTMPGWLQSLVAVNPVALLVTAVRGVLGGTAAAGDIALALAGPAALTLVCVPVALRLYRRER